MLPYVVTTDLKLIGRIRVRFRASVRRFALRFRRCFRNFSRVSRWYVCSWPFALRVLDSNSDRQIKNCKNPLSLCRWRVLKVSSQDPYLYSCRDKFLTYFSGGLSLSWFWKLTLLAVVWDTWVAGIVNST